MGYVRPVAVTFRSVCRQARYEIHKCGAQMEFSLLGRVSILSHMHNKQKRIEDVLLIERAKNLNADNT